MTDHWSNLYVSDTNPSLSTITAIRRVFQRINFWNWGCNHNIFFPWASCPPHHPLHYYRHPRSIIINLFIYFSFVPLLFPYYIILSIQIELGRLLLFSQPVLFVSLSYFFRHCIITSPYHFRWILFKSSAMEDRIKSSYGIYLNSPF